MSELDSWLQSRGLHIEEDRKQKAEALADAEAVRRPRTQNAGRWLVLGGVALVTLLAVAYIATRHRPEDTTAPKIKSLAVLPLKNLSGDSTQEYLADGITEALIGRLAAIHDLRVVSRTSVMRFKETQLVHPGNRQGSRSGCHRRGISDT